MELIELKKYLNIEDEWKEDDSLVLSLFEAAKIILKSSTGRKYNEKNSLHKLIIQLMVVHQYDNRTIYTVDKHKDLSYSLKHLLFLATYADEGEDDEA